MGANEDRLRQIAATDPFDLPGLAPMRTSLETLRETLRGVASAETWEGEAAKEATQAMADMRVAYAKVDELLGRLESQVGQANVYRSKAIAAVEGLPDSKAPSWVHTALNAAEPFSFPGIGPVDVAQGGLGIVENFLGNKREEAAATALEDYSADLQTPTAEMRAVREELSDRKPRVFGEDPGGPAGTDGGTGGTGGGYPGGSGTGTGTGTGNGNKGGHVVEIGRPNYVAPPPVSICEIGPPSYPVPDDTSTGYLPGNNPTYGTGGNNVHLGNSGGSGGIGAGGVLGGIGAAGAIAAVKAGAGGLGGLSGTVGKLGSGGMLGASGLAGRPGAPGGTGLIGNTGGGAGGAGSSNGAGAAGSRSGAAGTGGRSGMSAMHSSAGGAGGKEEKRRARVGLAGLMAPKLDDDNLGPRAAGTRAGGRDTELAAELPDVDGE